MARDDGERLDFELLSQRIHPADSRVRMLAGTTPAAFVAFDLLALGDEDLRSLPFRERRSRLEEALPARSAGSVHLSPLTADPEVAMRWFTEFEGAGLDGVIGKDPEAPYQPGKRVLTKLKHERTADCVVAGYRTHKTDDEAVGSLLLGLYDEDGTLASVGVSSSFPMARRRELFVASAVEEDLAELRGDPVDHAQRSLLDAGLAQARAMGARVVLVIAGKARPVDVLLGERLLDPGVDGVGLGLAQRQLRPLPFRYVDAEAV